MLNKDVKIGMKVILTKSGHIWHDSADENQDYFGNRSPNGTILEVIEYDFGNDARSVYKLSDDAGYYVWRFEPYVEFNVGDRVKIIGESYAGERRFIGREGTVTKVFDTGARVTADGDELDRNWHYMNENLELIIKTAAKKLVGKVVTRTAETEKIGDRSFIGDKMRILDVLSNGQIKVEFLSGYWGEQTNGDQYHTLSSHFNDENWIEIVDDEQEEIKMSIEDAYLMMQEASGIKVGDTVKVLRAAKDYEMGWNNSWTCEMNESVGTTFVVEYITNNGIRLNDKHRFLYPFFVLEKVEKKALSFSDLPLDVLVEARDTYTKKLDDVLNKTMWTSSMCSICQYVKKEFNLPNVGRDFCRNICPLVKDKWCDAGEGETSKLCYYERKSESQWRENVAKFLCLVNCEIAKR